VLADSPRSGSRTSSRDDCTGKVAGDRSIPSNVLALPGRKLTGAISTTSPRQSIRRRAGSGRATIDNKDVRLKPETFANVTLYSPAITPAGGLPKQALIYEGKPGPGRGCAEGQAIELREIKPEGPMETSSSREQSEKRRAARQQGPLSSTAPHPGS